MLQLKPKRVSTISISDMAGIVHPRSAVVRLMTVLKAYFDESGFQGPVFTLCGYVAPEDEWKKFDLGWDKLLKQPCLHPITHRHMDKVCEPLDFLHAANMEGIGKGRFRALGQRNRNYLIDSSVGVITRSGIVGVGTGVVVSTFNSLPKRARDILKSPYEACMRYVVAEVKEQAKQFLLEPTGEKIAYIFARSPKWTEKAYALYDDLKTDYGDLYRMGSITVEDMEKFGPLQGADRLAYETFKHFSEPDIRRPNWNRLFGWPQHNGRYMSTSDAGGFLDRLRELGEPV